MTFWLRFTFGLVTWILYTFLLVPFYVAGLIIVPWGYFKGLKSAPSNVLPSPTILANPAPAWMWLWSNQEDGWTDNQPLQATKSVSEFLRVFYWAAIRNPVDSMRFVKWLMPPQKAASVRWQTQGAFTLVWQGWRSRMIYTGTAYTLWWGWHYYPQAQDAVGWSAYGPGFTLKLLKTADVDPSDVPPKADRLTA